MHARKQKPLTANLARRALQRCGRPLGSLQLLLQLLLPCGGGAQVRLQALRAAVQRNHLRKQRATPLAHTMATAELRPNMFRFRLFNALPMTLLAQQHTCGSAAGASQIRV